LFKAESEERKKVGAALASTLEALSDVVAKLISRRNPSSGQNLQHSATLAAVGQKRCECPRSAAMEQTSALVDVRLETAQRLEAIAETTNHALSEAGVRATAAFAAATSSLTRRVSAEQRWLAALVEAQSQQAQAMAGQHSSGASAG
jgi:hypothetical protein